MSYFDILVELRCHTIKISITDKSYSQSEPSNPCGLFLGGGWGGSFKQIQLQLHLSPASRILLAKLSLGSSDTGSSSSIGRSAVCSGVLVSPDPAGPPAIEDMAWRQVTWYPVLLEAGDMAWIWKTPNSSLPKFKRFRRFWITRV